MPTPRFLIVGSGIAGLRAALELAAAPAEVLVLTKAGLDDSATSYAQGGIAAALAEDDSAALHEEDTLRAGDGLCDPAAVEILAGEGPGEIERLLAWGANFDPAAADDEARAGGLALTREGAHSRSRILHAHGDSTGREIGETLLRRAREHERIRLLDHLEAARLLQDATGAVLGVECRPLPSGAAGDALAPRPGRPAAGEHRSFFGPVLLATGGLGRVFSDTTNPAIATGDGVAIAARAGALAADMEFIQFHPTALALAGAPRFLLSEALRGEGALLRNAAGQRFLPRYDPRAELAPRDVVSRAIERELRREAATGAAAACFLDARGLGAEHLRRRFPRILAKLREFGLDPARDLIPVRPAAHYAMGGVWTDLSGRTSLPGLFAAGEVACTGVHGANRLASNSLLEGLVFGARAARAMLAMGGEASASAPSAIRSEPARDADPKRDAAAIAALRAALWRAAGVLRSAGPLRSLREELAAAALRSGAAGDPGLAGPPLENLCVVGALIAAAALAREESRGAHFREDFPRPSPALEGRHSFQRLGEPVRFAPAPRAELAEMNKSPG